MFKFKKYIILFIVALFGVEYYLFLESREVRDKILAYYYEHSAIEVYDGQEKSFFPIKNGQLQNKGLSISSINDNGTGKASFYVVDPKSESVRFYLYNKETKEFDVIEKKDGRTLYLNKDDIIWSSREAGMIPFYERSLNQTSINQYSIVKGIDSCVLVEDAEAFYILENEHVDKLIDKNKRNFIGETDEIYFLAFSSKKKSAIFISNYKPWDLLKGTRWRYFFVDLNSKKTTILYPKDISENAKDHVFVLGVIDD